MSYGNNKLPARERIHILSKRLINLKKGAGNYLGQKRDLAILDCEGSLEDAQNEYRRMQ